MVPNPAATEARPDYGVQQTRPADRVYYGVIVDSARVSPRQRRVYWYCEHNHTTKQDALRCARRHVRHQAGAI